VYLDGTCQRLVAWWLLPTWIPLHQLTYIEHPTVLETAKHHSATQLHINRHLLVVVVRTTAAVSGSVNRRDLRSNVQNSEPPVGRIGGRRTWTFTKELNLKSQPMLKGAAPSTKDVRCLPHSQGMASTLEAFAL
jgi:hypothetical protein